MQIIKFSAPWCEPCKIYSPIYEKAISKLPQVDSIGIDLEEQPDKWAKYKIMSVLTTMIVDDNDVEVFRHAGPMTEAQVTSLVKEHFKI